MLALKLAYDTNNLRDAVISVKTSAWLLRNAVTHDKVRSRHIKNAIDLLKEYASKHRILEENDENDLNLHRVISDITNTKELAIRSTN